MVGLPITLIPERSTKKVGPFIPAPLSICFRVIPSLAS
jgi:hypothetical protein